MLRVEKRGLRGFKSLRGFKHSMSWKGPFCRSRESQLGSIYKTAVCCVSVCTCVCSIYIHVWMFVYICTCVYIHVNTRSWPCVFSSVIHIIYLYLMHWGRISYRIQNFWIQLVYPAWARDPRLCVPGDEITSVSTKHLHDCWGPELKSSFLHDKCFFPLSHVPNPINV